MAVHDPSYVTVRLTVDDAATLREVSLRWLAAEPSPAVLSLAVQLTTALRHR